VLVTGRLSYVTLGVTDLPASTRFYTHCLGFEPLASSTDDVTFLDAGGVRLALYPREALAGAGSVTMPATAASPPICLSCNVDSAGAVERLLTRVDADDAAAVTRTAGPAPWGGVHGWFTDPEGFLWEVAWNPADGQAR
jgi:catechol 2,3-dioxygenase-like lactoylglutathione lyase family enzyme